MSRELILNKDGRLNAMRCWLNRLWLCTPTEKTTLCALTACVFLGIIGSGLISVLATICFMAALILSPLFGTWPKLGTARAGCPPVLGLWKFWQPDKQKYHNLCVKIDQANIPPVVFFCLMFTVLLESGVFHLTAEGLNKFEQGLILIIVLIGYATALVAALAGVILLLAGIFLSIAAIVQLFIWLHKKMCIPVIFK